MKVLVDQELLGKEHLAMVLQKFDWTKCLDMVTLVIVNDGPVLAIVDIRSAGVVI